MRDSFSSHGALTLLIAIHIVNEVFGTIRPCISACAILFTIFPSTFQTLTVRIVQCASSVAFVEFELTLVSLTVRPKVGSLPLLLAHVEVTEVEAAIGPLEQALTMHGVVDERALIDLASRADRASESIDLPLLEVAFEEGIARVDLEAHAIGLKRIQANLAPELGAASAQIEVHFHLPLRVHIIVSFVVLVVIERSQDFVDVLHDLVRHVLHHIVIIGEGKLVAQLNDVAIESLP